MSKPALAAVAQPEATRNRRRDRPPATETIRCRWCGQELAVAIRGSAGWCRTCWRWSEASPATTGVPD